MIVKEEAKDFNKIGLIFWLLLAANFLGMALWRYVTIPMPVSLFIEIFYFITIIHCVSNNIQYGDTLSKAFGTMLGIYSLWLVYSFFEVGNMTSELDYATIFNRWFAEIRILALQAVYGIIIYATIFNSSKKIKKLHRVWGYYVIASVAKVLMQKYIGFDYAEREYLAYAWKTHFVNGIIRYFSFFTDAANYGSNMACTVVVFAALSFTASKKKDKIFYTIIALIALYGMMASGTRSAIIALAAGLIVYCVISKNITAIISTCILGLCTVGFLMFTNIGQGNSMIRRMRSAFNKDDASLAVREMNKIAMERYLAEVPIGIGAGIRNGDVPPSNHNYFLSIIPPDSTWVYVNIRFGYIGKFCFLFSFFGMCAYGAYVTLTKVKEKEVVGQMAATVSGATAMTVAGYSNHIMLQYPNCMIFFGALGMICVAEVVDKKARIEQEEETRRLLELQQAEEADAIELKDRGIL